MSSPDLELERQRSALSARQLAFVLHGGRANVERLEHLESLLAADPVFANPQEMYYLPREQQYRRATKMAGRAEILARRNGLSEEDTALLHVVLQSLTGYPSSTALHTGMFFKNLALLFTDEQQQQWMALAKQWRMVGCYAQTELGHGSNVRGLETTATYIPETDEFEIHSPTLTSIKWWPGALARTANFAVVYARLILADGRDYGVHNFMVQLRDLETHAPLAGVTLGDIGPKIGFNNVDNGYCRFTKVRIPREQMGMRVSKVTREGKYVKQAGVPQEVLYFTMLQTRMSYIRTCGLALGKACTIAIRYSAVRRQGYDATNPKAAEELQVLDYQTQQYRLLPLLAASYAITLTGYQVDAFSLVLSDQIKRGDLSMLLPAHAMSCGLKVVTSEIACEGIEVCRRACGGHGYLLSSGFPVLLGDILQTVTAEGENFVLSLQTARVLLKMLGQFRATGKAPKAMEFLADIDKVSRTTSNSKAHWLNAQTYLSVFEHRFLYLLRGLEKKVSTESNIAAGIQKHSMHCYKAANAYTAVVLVKNFSDAVAAIPSSDETGAVLRKLLSVFALTQLEAKSGEFLESGCVLPNDMPVISGLVEELLPQLRPHAVKLVDGFNFSDRALNSVLGRYDGNVYSALYDSAQLDPLNAKVDGQPKRTTDAIALHELLLPIRDEIARLEKERTSRL